MQDDNSQEKVNLQTEDKSWVSQVKIENGHPILPEFEWDIPFFAVISGINGSGKTKFLEGINSNISHKDNIYSDFINVTHFGNGIKFVQHNEDFSNLDISIEAANSSVLEEAKNMFPTSDERYDFESYSGRMKSSNFSNMYIAKVFKAYSEEVKNIIVEKNNLGILCAKEDAYEIIGVPPPWETINKLFDQYKFYYHISEPDYTKSYSPVFEDKYKTNKEPIRFSQLSSGEQIIVTLILWAYNNQLGEKIKTLLLDEFDAHLNPSLSEMLIDVIKNTLVKRFGMQVIMTTHSPSTIAHVDDEDLFWMERGQPIRKSSKKEIIPILSNGIMTYQEASGLLECIVSSNSSIIIFTEGNTDVIHMKTAQEKLGNKLTFAAFPCDCAGKLRQFLIGCPPKLFSDKKIIGIFDYDIEGLNSIRNGFNNINIENNLYQSKSCDNVFAMHLPVPNQDIKKCKCCPIEYLYSKDILHKYDMIERMDYYKFLQLLKAAQINRNDFNSYMEKFNNGSETLCYYSLIENNKTRFAQEIVPALDAKEFENFKPLFETITYIINHGDKNAA